MPHGTGPTSSSSAAAFRTCIRLQVLFRGPTRASPGVAMVVAVSVARRNSPSSCGWRPIPTLGPPHTDGPSPLRPGAAESPASGRQLSLPGRQRPQQEYRPRKRPTFHHPSRPQRASAGPQPRGPAARPNACWRADCSEPSRALRYRRAGRIKCVDSLRSASEKLRSPRPLVLLRLGALGNGQSTKSEQTRADKKRSRAGGALDFRSVSGGEGLHGTCLCLLRRQRLSRQ